MVANTVVGPVNFFEACVAAGVTRFVLVSSFSVIGAAGVSRRGVIDEAIELEPHPERRDAYAFAKHRQEILAWEHFRNHGLPLVVVRPGVIFGSPKSILGPRIGVDVFGVFLHLGGRARIPLIFVDNCAELIARAGLVPDIDGEVFCAVDDDLPTSRQLLRRYNRDVKRLWRVRIPYMILKPMARLNVWYSKRTQGHWPALFKPYEVDTLWKGHRYSNEKAKRVLGWRPGVPMAEALDRTFAFLESEAAQSSAQGS
jgi:nucleoside-diphosphate-sugar epimerase